MLPVNTIQSRYTADQAFRRAFKTVDQFSK